VSDLKRVGCPDAALYANTGLTNTILSHLLFSKYITQISNQLSLHRVFLSLFQKEGAEVNFIEMKSLEKRLQEDLMLLKTQLIKNDMVYLGVVHKDGSIHFDSHSLHDARKVIVFSNGVY